MEPRRVNEKVFLFSVISLFICIGSDVHNTKSGGRFGSILLRFCLARTAGHFSFNQFGHRDRHRFFGWVGKEFTTKKKIFPIGESKVGG